MDIFASIGQLYGAISEFYLGLWTLVDHRVDNHFLMSSAKPLIILLMLYFTMVYFGPKLMEKRKPWEMTKFLIIYNVFIILLNLYIVIQLFIGATRRKYTWFCDVPDILVTDAEEMRIVKAVHLYTVSKLIEWLDTFCFIVRKKKNQLSKLHCYHHSTMLVFCWVATRWMASGSTFFPMIINSAVHVIMYSYYALSALGPSVQKYLWWKRYITTLQLVQFLIGFLNFAHAILTGCEYNTFLKYLAFFYDIGYIVLFGMFYQSNYVRHKKSLKKDQHSTMSGNGSYSNSDRLNNDYAQNSRKRTVVTVMAST